MVKPKIILGIESSCDETACAIVQKEGDRVTILSNVVASSASLQSKYGGVIPEQAAREQLKSIIPVIQEALTQANIMCHPELDSGSTFAKQRKASLIWIPDQVRNDKIVIPPIDAIAVTYGPGLIGSLLVGVETAKVLSLLWEKPLIPVNHLLGHFYANWISPLSLRALAKQSSLEIAASSFNKLRTSRNDNFVIPQFPCIGLLVSGGHTDLVLFQDHGKYKYLGGTRDDAAGECFDKCARLLDLGYPGGPIISKMAEKGNPKAYNLPRPMISSGDFDFSFSGLKTAVLNIVSENSERLRKPECQKTKKSDYQIAGNSDLSGTLSSSESFRTNLCASIEQAIIDVLITKTVRAAKVNNVTQILVAGGVAANQRLANQLVAKAKSNIPHVRVFIPPPALCTDNAAYVATATFYNFHPADPKTLQANPNLSLVTPEG